MIRYEYRCDKCGAKTCGWREIEDRHLPEPCPLCKADCSKLISIPMINADLIKDRPENKWGLGRDNTEILETMRADDKAYNDHWDGKWKDQYSNAMGMDIPHETVTKEPVPTMLDTAKKKGIRVG